MDLKAAPQTDVYVAAVPVTLVGTKGKSLREGFP